MNVRDVIERRGEKNYELITLRMLFPGVQARIVPYVVLVKTPNDRGPSAVDRRRVPPSILHTTTIETGIPHNTAQPKNSDPPERLDRTNPWRGRGHRDKTQANDRLKKMISIKNMSKNPALIPPEKSMTQLVVTLDKLHT